MNAWSYKGVLIALVAATFAGLWAFLITSPHRLGHASVLDRLEATLLDFRHLTFGPAKPSDKVVIVAIDDATLQEATQLGQGRQRLARVVESVARANASAIAIDILLTEAGDAEADGLLLEVISSAPSVLAVAASKVAATSNLGIPATSDELWPEAVFSERATTGISNVSTSHSGVPVYVPMAFLTSRGVQPALAAQTASLLSGEPIELTGGSLKLGERNVPLDLGFQMPLRLLGPRGTVPTLSAIDVLQGRSSEALAGKAVIIGVTATGLGDLFPTPFDQDLPGVEVIATAVGQLVDRPGLFRDGAIRSVEAWISIPIAALCAVFVVIFPISRGLIIGMIFLSVWIGTAWLAFPFGYWLSVAVPLVGVAVPMTPAVFYRYAKERYAATSSERVIGELKKFQSPVVAEMISNDPDFLENPESRQIVVSFVDLTGFTGMSQNLGPVRSEAFLKQFHRLLSEIVAANSGTVLNFMGDGALIVFGAFDEARGAADSALTAAFEIVQKTLELGRQEGLDRPLRSRIGLHRGDVVMSRMGGDRHQQLTVTGDAVNLCSRLLEITKGKFENIAATDEFVSALREAPTQTADVKEDCNLRGRQGNVTVHFWRL